MKNTKFIFNTYSHYYDLLYQDKDYAGEVEYIHGLLAGLGVDRGNLLEFGSGTGKHGCLLADRGYTIFGIEQSSKMVVRAKLQEGFACQVGDIRNLELGRRFDAVLSLFHVLSYQTSNEDISSVFTSAFKHLNKGGLFIFDFWYSPAVYAQQPTVRVKRMRNAEVEITRLAEPIKHPNANCVDVNYTIFARDIVSEEIKISIESHPMRHFSLPEIDLLAAMQGFRRIGAEEFLTGKSPGEDTWGVCVILEKI
jgi:SAM-dependent methyltransferase